MKTLLAAVIFLACTGMANAQNLIQKTSPHDVKTTIDRIATEIQRMGGGVLGRVNHAGIAEGANLPLRPNMVIIFGSPELGTPLMQSNPRIGLELPLRMSAYEGKDGRVYVVYSNFTKLAEIYGVTDENAVAKVMNTLDRIANHAVTDTTNAAINE